MNWTVKFNLNEAKEISNQPWLLIDNSIEMGDLRRQAEVLNNRGWNFFKSAVRGKYFPELNLTTVTSYQSEKTKEDDFPIDIIKRTFPGATIVSMVGHPHVLHGHVSNDILSSIDSISSQSVWNKTIKTAKVEKGVPYYQDFFSFEVADIDRYLSDRYYAYLTLQETFRDYSIGFQLYNEQVGLTGNVMYWHYDKGDFKRAKKTFSSIKNVLVKTMSDIEYYRPPMAVIGPMVKAALGHIDVDKRERSGNAIHNKYLELASESDWRQTLYSGHYPTGTIETLDCEWNKDEASKEISTKGTNSRSRIFLYKPSHSTTVKLAYDLENLKLLLKNTWQIASMGAAGGVLAWLINLGIPPNVIEHKLQQGVTPQQLLSWKDDQPNEPVVEQPIIPQQSEQKQPSVQPEKKQPSVQPEQKQPSVQKPQQVLPKKESPMSQVNSQHLAKLDQNFASKVQKVLSALSAKGWQPQIAESLRTIKQQQEKINQGFSFLKNPNNSKHVHGLAVDIIDKRFGWSGKASSHDFQFWKDLGAAATDAGLTWGGSWKTPDVAHIEMKK